MEIQIWLVCLCFTLPPLIITTTPASPVITYNVVRMFFYGLVALVLCRLNEKAAPIRKPSKNIIVSIALSFLCLGLLFISSIFFQYINNLANSQSDITYLRPKSIAEVINIISGIIIFAFYEEALYRYYLPSYFSELLVVLIFALSHLQNGVFAVLNAFFCGIILRFLVKKTSSLYWAVFVHSLFNLLSIIEKF